MAHIDKRSSTTSDLLHSNAVIHVIDADGEVQFVLRGWLSAAGIESRSYSNLGAFLNARRIEQPGCVVIDVQRLAIDGLESLMLPLPHVISYPVVVTACHADVAMAVRAMKIGANDFVEKPLREAEIVVAVRSAIKIDSQQRLIASRHAELHARFETLSRREREVMALVTAGKMNKQVGADLGVSEITVKAHRGAMMRKMGTRSLADLVRMADALGKNLQQPPPRNGNSAPARSAAAADRHSGYSPAPS